MKSLLRRPVLLLSAAATVTIPGALAAFALLGHDNAVHAAAASPDSAAAQSSNQQRASGPQVGAADVSAAEADLVPGLTSAGTGMSPAEMHAGAATGIITAARNQVRGVQLLQAAAKSGVATSYEGVEMISDVAIGGSATVVATVWHRSGVTVTQTATGETTSAAAPSGSQAYVSYDGDGREPEGVFGVTTTLVGLLAKNYIDVYDGQGTAAGRPALIVAVRRTNGSLAAQFWLDKQTMLPLRRDVYDTQAHLVSDDAFVKLSIGQMAAPAAGQNSSAQAAVSSWTAASAPATFLGKLNDQGWHLPGGLPGNLGLYAAAQTSTTSGKVIDLGFSDGLSVVSLFVQRGTLPAKMPGWQRTRIGGHSAYVNGHEVTLSAQGFVYTLVADAPVPVVDDAVEVLPPETGPGVLNRIGRGFARLAAMVDPFK